MFNIVLVLICVFSGGIGDVGTGNVEIASGVGCESWGGIGGGGLEGGLGCAVGGAVGDCFTSDDRENTEKTEEEFRVNHSGGKYEASKSKVL